MFRFSTFLFIYFLFQYLIVAQTEIKVWYSSKFPYAYTDSAGQLKGLDIELVQKFAQYLSKKDSKKYTPSFTEYFNVKHIHSISNQLDSGDIILPDYYNEVDTTKFLKSNVFRANTYIAVSNKGFKPIEKIKNNNVNLFIPDRTIILKSAPAKNRWINKWYSYTNANTKTIVATNADTILKLLDIKENFLIYVTPSDYARLKEKIQDRTTLHPLFNYNEQAATFILPLNSKYKNLFDYFLDPTKGYLSTKNYEALLLQYLPEKALEKGNL
jgi:hypothetical protein